jgi:hypothetical protein
MQIYLALTGNDRRYTKEKCLQNVLFIGDEAKWSYIKGRRNGFSSNAGNLLEKQEIKASERNFPSVYYNR